MSNDLNKAVDSSIEEVKKVLSKKKNKGAAIGATVGYLISKDNKERNALLGGLAGYVLSGDEEDDDEE